MTKKPDKFQASDEQKLGHDHDDRLKALEIGLQAARTRGTQVEKEPSRRCDGKSLSIGDRIGRRSRGWRVYRVVFRSMVGNNSHHAVDLFHTWCRRRGS